MGDVKEHHHVQQAPTGKELNVLYVLHTVQIVNLVLFVLHVPKDFNYKYLNKVAFLELSV